jgi:hypothetical protein
MTPDALIARVAAQPVITVDRVVSEPGPQMSAELSAGGGMLLNDYLSHPDLHRKRRTFRYGHILGPSLAPDTISQWQAAHPTCPLPPDLCAMLAKFDGVHLWANLDLQRSEMGLLPLAEWEAATDQFRDFSRDEPRGRLALSYGANGDYMLFLHTQSQEYCWHDLEDFDSPQIVAAAVEPLLDFLWEQAATQHPEKWLATRSDR